MIGVQEEGGVWKVGEVGRRASGGTGSAGIITASTAEVWRPLSPPFGALSLTQLAARLQLLRL